MTLTRTATLHCEHWDCQRSVTIPLRDNTRPRVARFVAAREGWTVVERPGDGRPSDRCPDHRTA